MKKANCPICTGEIKAGTTTFTADLGHGVVVIRQVPAQICTQYGEEWMDDEVADHLEEIVADVW